MAATSVLDRDMTFLNVPLKSTKRGFSIPHPAVQRITLSGSENPKDREWDGRSVSFSPHLYPRLCIGSIKYKAVGKAGYTKTVIDAREASLADWTQARLEWRQYLRVNAEDFTNTHAAVFRSIGSSQLITRGPTTSAVPIASTVVPVPTQLVVTNSPLPMKTWDPNDERIAADLFEVPADNPNFIPDSETFSILDAQWKLAMENDEPRMILIYGDTSTGKTEHGLIWCARRDVLHCRIDCGAFGEIYDVTGPIKAVERNGSSITEWAKGKTIRAMADPRPAVILLDEVNRISDVKAMNVLFPFFDSARQSYFDDNQQWMKLNGVKLIIATMNGDTRGDDIGEYVGTQPLDQAFVSRFPVRRQLRYPDAQKLAKILEARNGGVLTPETIDTVSQIAVELVALNKFVPNLRELFAAMDFMKQGVDLFHALKWTVGGIYKDDGTVACDYVSFKAVLNGKNINTDEP